MKFPIAYYLLLLYLTVILKPLMPLIGDAWEHTFAESIHIATVHAKYGANHLEKTIAEAGPDNTSRHQTSLKSVEVVPLHITEESQSIRLFALSTGNQHNHYQLDSMPLVFITGNYPPPKLNR